MNTPQPTPWYRQFWPWFLIFLPSIAVIASIYTIIIASQNSHQMVDENYYLEGLSINERIRQDQRTQALDLRGNLLFSEETQRVNLYLSNLDKPAARVILTLSAPDDVRKDRSFTLKPVNDKLYSAALENLPEGRFYVNVEPAHREWRLLGEIRLPSNQTLLLTGPVNPAATGNE